MGFTEDVLPGGRAGERFTNDVVPDHRWPGPDLLGWVDKLGSITSHMAPGRRWLSPRHAALSATWEAPAARKEAWVGPTLSLFVSQMTEPLEKRIKKCKGCWNPGIWKGSTFEGPALYPERSSQARDCSFFSFSLIKTSRLGSKAQLPAYASACQERKIGTEWSVHQSGAPALPMLSAAPGNPVAWRP